MLKVHFIKKFFLLQNVFWTSPFVTLWRSSLICQRPGVRLCSRGRARFAGPGGGRPRLSSQEGPTGRGGPGSSKLQVTVVVVGACAPTSVFPQQSWLLSGSVGAEAPFRVWFGVHNPGDAGVGLGIWVRIGRFHC